MLLLKLWEWVQWKRILDQGVRWVWKPKNIRLCHLNVSSGDLKRYDLTYHFCLVVDLPLWKIWVRQSGLWNSQYMENNPNVPNHQPDLIWVSRPMLSKISSSTLAALGGLPRSEGSIWLARDCPRLWLNVTHNMCSHHVIYKYYDLRGSLPSCHSLRMASYIGIASSRFQSHFTARVTQRNEKKDMFYLAEKTMTNQDIVLVLWRTICWKPDSKIPVPK